MEHTLIIGGTRGIGFASAQQLLQQGQREGGNPQAWTAHVCHKCWPAWGLSTMWCCV